MSKPISRKTLAAIIGGDMTEARLRFNEKRWGLDAARVDTGSRMVLYVQEAALAILKKRKLA